MGNQKKYEGGSTLVSFRLPTVYLEETKKFIDAYLSWFENIPSGENPVSFKFSSVGRVEQSPMFSETFEAKDENLISVVVENSKDGIVYSCGCIHDGVLFRRSEKCHLEVSKHIK
jgi:hypothetical protein